MSTLGDRVCGWMERHGAEHTHERTPDAGRVREHAVTGWWCGTRDWVREARLAWATGTRFAHAYASVRGNDVTLALAAPGLALWAHATVRAEALPAPLRWLLARAQDGYHNRETGVHVTLPGPDEHDLRVRWRVHARSDEWSSKTPRWRDGSWNVTGWLFGGPHMRLPGVTVVRTAEVDVPMPERSYRWRVELTDEVFGWPRVPFGRVYVRRAHCDALDGEAIPVPGKGENAHDMGEDALHGSTMPAHSVDDAVAKIVASATHTRLRYGSADWRPEPARPAAVA